MDLEKEFKKIKAITYKWYKKDKGDWFPNANGQGSEKAYIDESLNEKLENIEEGIFFIFSYFKDMSQWKNNQSQYALLYREDKKRFYKEFAEAAEYGYLRYAMTRKSFANLGMREVGYILAMNILALKKRQYTEIAETMIYSLDNYNPDPKIKKGIGCLINNGSKFYPAIWFILDLYCTVHSQSYDKSKADLPKNYSPYEEALKVWDTTDLNKVDQLVYNMCDIHIMRAINKDELEQEFIWEDYRIFVFEIEVWLTFRKMKGLENPTKFSHYFMQEPLSQVFPIEEPLPYPDLLEVEKLLTLHHEVYPKEDALEILTSYKNERKNG